MRPELAAAQRRLDKMAMRHGPSAAMRAYEIASGYLQYTWRIDNHPYWYAMLLDRWQKRVRTAGALAARSTWQLPSWAVHPECTAVAAVFASPYWAALALPVPSRQHCDIREQARWGRLLNDPDWGAPPPATAIPKKIPFIDITDDYERSIGQLFH